MISKYRVAIILVLFGITWYAVQVTAEVHPVPIKKPLSGFPGVIADYKLSNTLQSSADVIEMLGVDDYIQYNYINPTNRVINLYVGYYESVGVDGGYHSPRNCIPGGGWGIDKITPYEMPTGTEGQNSSTVSEMIIRHGNEYQIVFYWYQNRGRIIASEYWEKIYQVLDALFMGRRGGTFVRIMATVPQEGSFEQTRKELEQFSTLVMSRLEEYLPGAVI